MLYIINIYIVLPDEHLYTIMNILSVSSVYVLCYTVYILSVFSTNGAPLSTNRVLAYFGPPQFQMPSSPAALGSIFSHFFSYFILFCYFIFVIFFPPIFKIDFLFSSHVLDSVPSRLHFSSRLPRLFLIFPHTPLLLLLPFPRFFFLSLLPLPPTSAFSASLIPCFGFWCR